MNAQQIGELQRVMNTIDGRDFIYNLVLESCGIDMAIGMPAGQATDYTQGMRKVGIDIFNLLVYHCHEQFVKMLDEQKQRRSFND